MSAQENESVFRRLIEEGFNKGNLAALDDLFAANFREHQNGVTPPTVEGVKRLIEGLRKAFPDLHLSIDEMVAQSDKTWARLTGRGTHGGPMMGLSPTGKPIRVDVIDICRFEDGRIAEHWGVSDRLGMMQQLGAVHQPPQTPG